MLLGNGAYGSRSEFVKTGSQTKVFKGVLGCSLGDLCGALKKGLQWIQRMFSVKGLRKQIYVV